MNILNIEYFLETAKAKNFTKAAAILHITQQTLSANIASLEKELGTPLFIRHTPLELTYAGEVFERYANTFWREYQTMQKEFQDIAQNKQGCLKVGIGHTRGRAIMPNLVAAFQSEYPQFQVQLVEGSNEDLHALLTEGEIDLAIANFSGKEPGISLHPFYNERIVLLISKNLLESLSSKEGYSLQYALEELQSGKLEILKNCPFVFGHPEDVTGAVSRYYVEYYHLNPQVRATSDNVETLLAMCVLGLGACFCPQNLLEMTLSQEKIESLYMFELSDKAKYQIHFGVRKDAYQWGAVKEFMRIAEESQH